jgi:signal transduction histidine kinase
MARLAHKNPKPPEPTPSIPERRKAEEDQRRSFLRMAAHELRTPLNAVIGFSDILAQELYGPLGSPQYREYATYINQSGLKLLNLVNQVIEIARLESGDAGLVLGAEPLDLALAECAAGAAQKANARRVRVTAEPPERPLAALADARALRSAVAALVQNAIAFSPEGGEVRLTCRSAGPLVVVDVENDGEGLDPVDLPRLMLPFEQGQNALTRAVEGAGLGWPMVKLLAEAMGGRFEVRTGLGEGLTASLVLRRASA